MPRRSMDDILSDTMKHSFPIFRDNEHWLKISIRSLIIIDRVIYLQQICSPMIDGYSSISIRATHIPLKDIKHKICDCQTLLLRSLVILRYSKFFYRFSLSTAVKSIDAQCIQNYFKKNCSRSLSRVLI